MFECVPDQMSRVHNWVLRPAIKRPVLDAALWGVGPPLLHVCVLLSVGLWCVCVSAHVRAWFRMLMCLIVLFVKSVCARARVCVCVCHLYVHICVHARLCATHARTCACVHICRCVFVRMVCVCVCVCGSGAGAMACVCPGQRAISWVS